MTPKENSPATPNASDRRRSTRYSSSLDIDIRFSEDGTPIKGACLDIASSGLRVLTPVPLVEATYVLISFQEASNNTQCEGRVVWTQRNSEVKTHFESGVDIHRWRGSMPSSDVVKHFPSLQLKKDRRHRSR